VLKSPDRPNVAGAGGVEVAAPGATVKALTPRAVRIVLRGEPVVDSSELERAAGKRAILNTRTENCRCSRGGRIAGVVTHHVEFNL